MKKKHPKRKKALRMLTKKEREHNVTPFNSGAWYKRSIAIIKRLKKKVKKLTDDGKSSRDLT
jgi:hypothetical protein